MKNLKKIVVAALLAVSASASAQFTNSSSSSASSTSTEGWNTFGFEYLPSSFSPKHGDSQSFTGLAITYTNANSLTKTIPLFFEWGIGAQYSHYSKNDFSINYVSLKVPLNLVYDYEIPGTSINLDPFIGLKLRGNVWGEGTEDDDYYGDDNSYDLFDKDEGDWNRFQIGWNIGLKARFNNKFFVGLSYGSDFSEMADDMKINEASISLGLVF